LTYLDLSICSSSLFNQDKSINNEHEDYKIVTRTPLIDNPGGNSIVKKIIIEDLDSGSPKFDMLRNKNSKDYLTRPMMKKSKEQFRSLFSNEAS